MPIDLSSYSSVASHLFVKIISTETLLFSDRHESTVIEGDTYLGLGNLMGITSSTNELRASNAETTITISGIPNTSITQILNLKLKGSEVKIYRGFFNATTNALLSISGNPMGRFQGFVNNMSLSEDYDVESRTSSNTLSIQCSSVVEVLSNKIAGRRTNPSSQNQFFPNDRSMDRVPAVENAYIDFGVKR